MSKIHKYTLKSEFRPNIWQNICVMLVRGAYWSYTGSRFISGLNKQDTYISTKLLIKLFSCRQSAFRSLHLSNNGKAYNENWRRRSVKRYS